MNQVILLESYEDSKKTIELAYSVSKKTLCVIHRVKGLTTTHETNSLPEAFKKINEIKSK